ncbi:MAG: hypothetical protein ABR530_09040 [Pyrinomonadaceae bacterium]
METALEKLKRMTAWDTEPALTEDDLNAALSSAALEDPAGLAPLHEEWTPTYDLNAAASAAWLAKAAKASALVEVDPPESGIVTSRVFDNCRAMSRLYAAKRSMTASVR